MKKFYETTIHVKRVTFLEEGVELELEPSAGSKTDALVIHELSEAVLTADPFVRRTVRGNRRLVAYFTFAWNR